MSMTIDGTSGVTFPDTSAQGFSQGYPVGEVCFFAMSTAPTGFIACSGQAVSRTTYSRLFAVIGTTYGVGDGSTTFNLPELRGEFIRALDNGRGVDTGRTIGSAQASDIAAHTHSLTNAWMRNSAGSGNISTVGGTADSTVGATGTNSGSETRPRNVALLACIRF